VLENIGAGEGNRTLVFSLEVAGFSNVFNGYSDIFGSSGPLRSLQNCSLSEWRLPFDTHFLPATDICLHRASKPINHGRGQTGFHFDVDERVATNNLFLQRNGINN